MPTFVLYIQWIERFVVSLLFTAMKHRASWLETVRFVHCLLSAPCSGLAPAVVASGIGLHPYLWLSSTFFFQERMSLTVTLSLHLSSCISCSLIVSSAFFSSSVVSCCLPYSLYCLSYSVFLLNPWGLITTALLVFGIYFRDNMKEKNIKERRSI